MSEQSLTDDLLAVLRRVDTPTVCNAIEVAQGSRDFRNYTGRTMVASAPEAPAMVGFARTAKIVGSHPPSDPPEVVKERRLEYYRAMASGPRPVVAVVEDQDYPDCAGAFWGEVNSTVHKGLGVSGTLTNGLVRDLGDLADGYPIVAGGIGPSHAFVHVSEVGTPVEILGMTVNDGDLVHADRHGGLVIPAAVVPKLGEAIETMFAGEAIILAPAREPGFTIEKLEAAWAAFEKART